MGALAERFDRGQEGVQRFAGVGETATTRIAACRIVLIAGSRSVRGYRALAAIKKRRQFTSGSWTAKRLKRSVSIADKWRKAKVQKNFESEGPARTFGTGHLNSAKAGPSGPGRGNLQKRPH